MKDEEAALRYMNTHDRSEEQAFGLALALNAPLEGGLARYLVTTLETPALNWSLLVPEC